MGKERKKSAEWTLFLKGSLAALCIYLAGLSLFALLLLKGILPESILFPGTAFLCLFAALCSGLYAAGRSPLGTLPAALANTAVFAGILIAVGAACWQGITWTGHAGVLLICALFGGVLAGLLGSGKGKKRKRTKVRAAAK